MVDQETATFKLGQRDVELRRPTSGQMFIVVAMADLGNEPDNAVKLEAVNNFGTVLRTCFVKPEDRQATLRALADGSLELEEYFQLAIDMISEFAPDEAANRTERRAERRAPAKKAVAVRKTGGRTR